MGPSWGDSWRREGSTRGRKRGRCRPEIEPLVQRGVDLYKVQRLLGHKTGLMTQRYAHHSPESLREGVNVLDRPQPQRVRTNLAQEAIVKGVARERTFDSD